MSVKLALSTATIGLHDTKGRLTAAASTTTTVSAEPNSAQSESSEVTSSTSGVTIASPIQPSPTLDIADTDTDPTGSTADVLKANTSYTATSAKVLKAQAKARISLSLLKARSTSSNDSYLKYSRRDSDKGFVYIVSPQKTNMVKNYVKLLYSYKYSNNH